MTHALCLACGSRKYGALSPCSLCGEAVVGSVDLQLLFSDHSLSTRTLDAFGSVVRCLKDQAETPELQIRAFLRLVAARHPELLGVSLPESELATLDRIIASAAPPHVIIRRSSASG